MRQLIKKYLDILPDVIVDKGITYRLFITKNYSYWIIKYSENENSFSKHIFVRDANITNALKQVLGKIFPEDKDEDIRIYKKNVGKTTGQVKLMPYIKDGITHF